MSDTSGTLSARTPPLYASGLMPAENRQHAQPGATPEAGDHDGAARLLTGQPPTPRERHREAPLGKRRAAAPILANRPYCSAPLRSAPLRPGDRIDGAVDAVNCRWPATTLEI